MQRIQLEAALYIIQRLGFYVRDIGLLDSALERPITRVYGRFVYPDLKIACAAQTESLARNHPLADGNKRTALIMLSIFLRLNGYKHVMDTETAYSYIMDAAQGKLSLEESAERLAPYLLPWAE